jgi:hypothetical protein
VLLAFNEFFTIAGSALQPSPKLRSLNGKRVRLVGYMALQEHPLKGAFYLCPRPVTCDESGGGTGALPPTAVRVSVRGAGEAEVAFIPRPIQVTGLLDLGYRTESNGGVSWVRLTLDQEKDISPHSAPAETPHPASDGPRSKQP